VSAALYNRFCALIFLLYLLVSNNLSVDFFNTYRPCEELQDIVEFYWRSSCNLEETLVQEMYTPTLQALTFNLSGLHEDVLLEKGCIRMDKYSYIIGQPLSKRTSRSNPKGIDILGVKFTPIGLYLLTEIDMKHISDKIIDASDIWNNEINFLYDEMLSEKSIQAQICVLERFLIGKRRKNSYCSKILMVQNTLGLMESRKMFSVSALREESPVTKKTLERYFLNHIGVTPKQYANISRFNNVLAYVDGLSSEPDWHDIIVSFGYYDQSHLIRDFKRYAGRTPTEYFSLIFHNKLQETQSDLKQIFN
jgi:AraC-like DNA-binding protein